MRSIEGPPPTPTPAQLVFHPRAIGRENIAKMTDEMLVDRLIFLLNKVRTIQKIADENSGEWRAYKARTRTEEIEIYERQTGKSAHHLGQLGWESSQDGKRIIKNARNEVRKLKQDLEAAVQEFIYITF
ncbi:hypothetical protein KC686_01355 [Candidatus Woesebacteria bacterium]|nr:hypothetical protein [Candidatus Woesebacteria bacterium]